MAGASIGNAFFNSGSSDVSYPGITQGFTAKTTNLGLNFSPSMGWFISDRTALGVLLTINPSHSKTTYEQSGTTYQRDEISTFHIGIGGFARNYFSSASSFMPFGQFSLNLGISSQNTEGVFYGGSGSGIYKISYEGKSSGGFFANASLAAGFTKLLSPHTGLDIFAGYTFSYNKNTFKETTNRDDGINGSIDQVDISQPTTQTTTHGFILGAGFQVFLEPRK